MQRWEYKSIGVPESSLWRTTWKEDGRDNFGELDIFAKVRALGLEGWELVAITPYGNPSWLTHWFKRPLREGVPPPLPKT